MSTCTALPRLRFHAAVQGDTGRRGTTSRSRSSVKGIRRRRRVGTRDAKSVGHFVWPFVGTVLLADGTVDETGRAAARGAWHWQSSGRGCHCPLPNVKLGC